MNSSNEREVFFVKKYGSTTTITGGTITSDADGANGVFSYGGTTYAYDLDVITSGRPSAAIRTDRGGRNQIRRKKQ